MTDQAEQVLNEALRLPEPERADIADKLYDSLASLDDNDVESAWDKEIMQRLEDHHTGKEKGVPWPEARKLILEDRDDDIFND